MMNFSPFSSPKTFKIGRNYRNLLTSANFRSLKSQLPTKFAVVAMETEQSRHVRGPCDSFLKHVMVTWPTFSKSWATFLGTDDVMNRPKRSAYSLKYFRGPKTVWDQSERPLISIYGVNPDTMRDTEKHSDTHKDTHTHTHILTHTHTNTHTHTHTPKTHNHPHTRKHSTTHQLGPMFTCDKVSTDLQILLMSASSGSSGRFFTFFGPF